VHPLVKNLTSLLACDLQESENCQMELKFARSQKVGMCPVMVQGNGWQATDWLG
jgi:hypothetical protein